MSIKQVDVYQIDENSFGEFLIAIPDMRRSVDSAKFNVVAHDLFITYDNGDRICLPDIPTEVRTKLSKAENILIVESNGKKLLRCYSCERT